MRRAAVVVLGFLLIFGKIPAYALGDSGRAYEGVEDFSLKNLEGEAVQLSAVLAQHKLVLLNFWATLCPPCIEETPDLVALQRANRERSFTVLGVNVGESQSRVKNFVSRHLINYPVLLDRQTRVAESYGVVGIPTSILLKSNGEVVGVYHAVTEKLKRDIEKNLS